MTKVTLNDQEFEAIPGERLLSLARRNGAHIGFMCDGNGMCTTCECQILEGEDQLSPVNEVEQVMMTPARLERGYRLACQTSLRGPGPVKAISRAEQFRRLAVQVVNGESVEERTQAGWALFQSFNEVNYEHLAKYPFNVFNMFSRLGWKVWWPVDDMRRLIDDMARMTNNLTGTQIQLPEALKPVALPDTIEQQPPTSR